jgi:adenylate kinase family enzyme
MGHDQHDDLDRRLSKVGVQARPIAERTDTGSASAPKTKRNAQAAKEERWRKNGCYKDASGKWIVPDELMWRSLPSGEDR